MIQWSTTTTVDPQLPPTDLQFAKTLKVTCPHCNLGTDAGIRGFIQTKQNEYHSLPHGIVVCNYLLECTLCSGAILLMWTHNLDQGLLGGDGPLTAGKLIFPHPSEPLIEDASALPHAIANDLSQAELCLNSGGVYGAAMLYRRACQYICLDADCAKKRLIDQIDELVIKDKILPDTASMAHNIRIIGNEIAHPNANDPLVITREDVLAAREFTRQLVQIIYVNPKRSKAVRQSLKSRNIKGT